MSATCDVHKLRTYFGDDCAIVEARGRSFEVRELYLEDVVEELAWRPPRPQHGAAAGGMPVSLTSECRAHDKFEDRSGALSAATVETVRSLQEWVLPLGLIAAILAWVARSEAPGSVLVFLPGWREIAACAALLSQDPQLRGYEVVRLHSTVPPDEQRRALGPAGHGRRKAILSTDIAETSVMWASKANLVQRRGRAGRVRDGTCVHLITRARFEALDAEPEPEMRRVPLEEESFRELGAHAGVAKFLEGAPDPPDTRNVRRAFYELMHLGVLDHQGYLTHLGALLARLPLPPRLGAALFLGGLLGAADAASLVAAAVEGREPWARRRDSDGGGSAARRFARGPGLTDEPWSDVFCSANALASFCTCGASAYRSRWASQNRFCNDHSLVLPVMQQMASAREQLSNSLREMGCDSGPCAQEVAAPAALIQDWPLMQTVLTFFGGEKLAELEGGRRAHAGWAKPARLEKSSVLCGGGGGAEEEPPSPLLAYADYSCGWDGRRRSAVFGGWLHVRAEPGDAAALGSLRAVTALVMQHAAKEAMRRWGSSWSAGSDEWLQQWRQCVVAVARSPAPARGSLWAPRPSPTLRAHAVPGQAPLARAAAAAAEVAPSESTLPFGWAAHVDAQAHQFFACQSTGESRWARPASEGPDGSAALWRWASRGEDGVCYLRTLPWLLTRAAVVAPLISWEAVWDAASQRHYYWSHLKEDGFTTWEVPQRPLLEVDGELARRFLEG
ncbi:unnamed protein product [Prorocentrum cordatum]|uniref:WW domain-containing protein n=1 Tax=Prorocentrum cordatum TaxID=2364126 RepID=A0ABN9URG4_9DINO|nr:unnamed protein product [Polarella glacialis]